MFKQHWNRKTGRGRWGNNRAPSASAAKRIVKKAGPMDRRLFTDTDRTDGTLHPRTWIPSGSGGSTGQDDISLFTPADYGEVALTFRERIRISTLEMRSQWNMLPSIETDHQVQRAVMWWVYIATAADFQAITASGIGPWSSTTSADYAEFAKVRTLKRGRFSMFDQQQSVLRNNGTWKGSANAGRKDLFIRFKKKLWLMENEQLCFSYRWWSVLQGGTSAGLAAVNGSLDTLIRWARY